MAGRTLQIAYVGDAKSVLAAQKQIDAGHTRMQGGATKTGGTLKNVFGSVIPGATFLTVAGVGLAAKAVVDAATTEAEAQNQVNVIFGDSVDTINRFAETSATAAGISKGAALEAAGGFGAMLKSAGLAQDEAANLSVSIVQLAGDLASFKNVAPEEALEKLRSGLAGEAEPLRQFGVFLSEAAVQAEAYKSGIAAVGEELTEAQKVQARYNIIIEQTKDAAGDFGETLGESLPNQLRALGAQATDLAADFGTVLLPVLLQLTKVVGFLMDNLPQVIAIFGTFATLRWLPGFLLSVAVNLERIGAVSLATGVLNVGTGIASVGASLATAAPLAVTFAGALVGLTAALAAWDPLGLVDDQEEFNRRFEEGTLHLGKFTSQTLFGKGPLDALGRSTVVAGESLEVMRQKAALTAGGITNLSGVVGRGADEQTEYGEAVKTATERLIEQLDATLALADPTFALISAVRDNRTAENELAAAHRRVNELQDEGKTSTKQYAEAKRNLRDAALAAAESEAGVAAAVRALDQEFTRGKTNRREVADALAAIGRQAGLSGKDIRGLQEDVRSGLSVAAALALRISPQIGRNINEGIGDGILETSELVAERAADTVHKAIAAANAAAGARSPSKRMHELGVNLMVGLANGISAAEVRAIQAIGKAIDNTIVTIEKRMERVTGSLERVRGQASTFGGGISGAIGGFGDLAGAFASAEGLSLSEVIAQQLGGAAGLANTLAELRAQGASTGLLSQAAGNVGFGQALLAGGPTQIEEANRALVEIAAIANATGKGLSEAFFGERISRLEDKLDVLHDDLRREREQQRVVVHIQNVIGPGGVEELTDIVRRELLRISNRNGDIFAGRA